VVEGEIEISIGDEKRLLKPNEVYFIPAGITHNWKTFHSSAKILDVVAVIPK
jgi:mannose-6-phosphate isomerase-like protein (cupin superfamily)